MVPSLNGPIRDTLRMAADVRPSSSKISTYSGAAASNKRRPRAEEKKYKNKQKPIDYVNRAGNGKHTSSGLWRKPLRETKRR